MRSGPHLVVFGKQGAGKGTQARLLRDHYGVTHLSTGQLFRDSVEAGVPAGLAAKPYLDRGELVPDDIVIAVVEERFTNPAEIDRGFILDGFPRTIAQAEELDRILGDHPLDLVIELAVPTDVVIERMEQRGRDDDTADGIRRRLELYEEETAPLADFYAKRGLMVRVDGNAHPDDVFKHLVQIIDDRIERVGAVSGR